MVRSQALPWYTYIEFQLNVANMIYILVTEQGNHKTEVVNYVICAAFIFLKYWFFSTILTRSAILSRVINNYIVQVVPVWENTVKICYPIYSLGVSNIFFFSSDVLRLLRSITSSSLYRRWKWKLQQTKLCMAKINLFCIILQSGYRTHFVSLWWSGEMK